MSTLKVNQITDLNDAEIFEPNLMTAVSASGTSVDFTGIPSWVKRITVIFAGVSTNGTSAIQVQLGDSGGFETTNYEGAVGTRTSETYYSAGFAVHRGQTAAATGGGTLTLVTLGSNIWAGSGVWGSISGNAPNFFAGSKTLSDTLTQIRITTANGTDTFDAGTINVMYE